MTNKSEKTRQKEIELVIARLEVLSPELHFSSGDSPENISRDEMIEHVKANDEVGQGFIKTELEFLRAFKDGTLQKTLATT